MYLKGKTLPFDVQLKGLVEFLFEDDLVCGFHIYWPNQQCTRFTRMSKGSHALNFHPMLQGGLRIDVGTYATNQGPFSRF